MVEITRNKVIFGVSFDGFIREYVGKQRHLPIRTGDYISILPGWYPHQKWLTTIFVFASLLEHQDLTIDGWDNNFTCSRPNNMFMNLQRDTKSQWMYRYHIYIHIYVYILYPHMHKCFKWRIKLVDQQWQGYAMPNSYSEMESLLISFADETHFFLIHCP